MAYSAERDLYENLKSMWEDNWNDGSGNVPRPEFILAVSSAARFDMNFSGDVVVIRMSPSGEVYQYRDQYHFYDIYVDFVLELYTKVSRQRLLDMKKELRRIIFAFMHRPDITGAQLIRAKSFIEETQTQLNIWQGKLNMSVEDNRLSIVTAHE